MVQPPGFSASRVTDAIHASQVSFRFCNTREEWNKEVLRLGGGLYHSWEWGELRATEGWKAWRLLAEVQNQTVCALQILEKPVPLAGALLYAPRGIAGSGRNPWPAKELAIWLKAFVRERHGIVLRMDPEFLDIEEEKKGALIGAGFANLPNQWSFWNLSRSGMVLDITAPADELLRNMRNTHRNLIRRADKDKVEIEGGFSEAQLQELYSMVRASSARQGFWIRELGHFSEVRDRFLPDRNVIIFVARREGRTSAAIMILRFGSTAYYFHGGFDPEVRNIGATEALHWRAIQWAKSQGCTRYDLMGSGTAYPPAEGNRGFGLYSFKKGFGAGLEYSAGYFDLVGNRAAYRVLRFAEQHPKLVDAALHVRSWIRLGRR